MIEDFKKAVLNYKSTASDPTKDIIWQLNRLFEQLQENTLTAANPTEVVQCLGIKDVWEQHDLGEYFLVLMNQIARTVPQSQVFLELFHTTQVRTLKCTQCKLKEDKQEEEEEEDEDEERIRVLEIPVPLMTPEKKPFKTVDDALSEIFRHEILTNDNQIYCDSCDEKCDAEMQYYFETLPNILVLQLKKCGSLTSFQNISLPSTLCFSKTDSEKDQWHLQSNSGKTKGELNEKKEITEYDLFVICRRMGGSKSGHYFADIKSNDQWYCFNDACVTQINTPRDIQEKRSWPDIYRFGILENHLSPPAYLLMYHKKDKPRNRGLQPDCAKESLKKHNTQSDCEKNKLQNKANYEQEYRKRRRKRPHKDSCLPEQQDHIKKRKREEENPPKSKDVESIINSDEENQTCKISDKEKQKLIVVQTRSQEHKRLQIIPADLMQRNSKTNTSHLWRKPRAVMQTTSLDRQTQHERKTQQRNSKTNNSHQLITERKPCAGMRTTSVDRHTQHERQMQAVDREMTRSQLRTKPHSLPTDLPTPSLQEQSQKEKTEEYSLLLNEKNISSEMTRRQSRTKEHTLHTHFSRHSLQEQNQKEKTERNINSELTRGWSRTKEHTLHIHLPRPSLQEQNQKEKMEQKTHLERKKDHIIIEHKSLLAELRTTSFDQDRHYDRMKEPIVTAIYGEKTMNKQHETTDNDPNSSPTEYEIIKKASISIKEGNMDEELEVASETISFYQYFFCCDWISQMTKRKERKQHSTFY
ncbi:ubiquitin carboxyl-terminal hydrolase 47-like isoform X2 [Protopterus annectens]|nr:ubiquitin carboxyl-terminal hydrolase 47-like isoform X2 [Protopterus annectens]